MAVSSGARPALMEDLATARISTAQTAQRLFHESPCEDTGRRHSPAMVKEILARGMCRYRGRLGDAERTRAPHSLPILIRHRVALDSQLYGTGFSQPRFLHARRVGGDWPRSRRTVIRNDCPNSCRQGQGSVPSNLGVLNYAHASRRTALVATAFVDSPHGARRPSRATSTLTAHRNGRQSR